jgi:putative membrane protein
MCAANGTNLPADRLAAAGTSERSSREAPARLSLLTTLRAGITGLLMGTANLIPGVSGGTMILAMGLYDEFIDSVAEITALRFSFRRVAFLGIIGVFAAGAIIGLAGVILYLLFHYTIAMFALFIGLTLGGAPLLFKSMRPVRVDVVVATLVGLGLMVGVLLLKSGSGMPHNTVMDFTSGVVGSTTMVLPGVSGSYMLLVLDQYERVVGAVDDLKQALRSRSLAALTDCLKIIVPVGIGAVLGIVGLSNLLKMLLRRYRRLTVGVLLGILLGSVVGLWPFGKAPSEQALERRTLAELRDFATTWQIPGQETVSDREALASYIAEHWQRRARSCRTVPSVGLAIACVAAGFVVTYGLSRGGSKSRTAPSVT